MSNAERYLITPEKLVGKDKYCSYVRAYFNAKGLSVGDMWVAHEYQSWITDRHDEFHKFIGGPRYLGYSPEEQKAFEKYIWNFDERSTEG